MVKEQLRKEYVERRKALSATQKNKWEDLILIQFQKLGLQIPDKLLSYMPMEYKNEYDPFLVEEYCSFKNPDLQLSYTKITGDFSNLHCIETTDDTTFDINKWGIAEPVSGNEIAITDVGMLFIPLLCFDVKGFRVGYGKGFYDKLLANASPEIIKVGFSFFEPVVKIEDVDGYDIPLNYCLTLENFYSF